MARAQLLEAATAALASRLDVVGTLTLASDESITSLLGLVGNARRAIDAIGAELAAQAHRRSELHETSLARRLGEVNAATLVSRLTSIPPGEAADWCAAGVAAEPNVCITGDILPPRHPATSDALKTAVLSPRAARTIAETLDVVSERTTPTEVESVEQVLLDYAPGLTIRELAKLCRQVVERYDPDGEEPREERLRAKSGIQVIHGRDGLVTWIMKMHPEAAGFLTAAVEARTSPRRVAFLPEPEGSDWDPENPDERTTPQKRLDALVDIARESLAHDNGTLAGTAVTLNVTMTLDALLSGVGAAHIHGIDAPISAGTARRLAADAQIIPIVLGGASEPLDVGHFRRLYTEAQRRALAIRDGGCVWTNCNAPPGWCEVAHVQAWSERGPTDLANGVLMCRFHHRRFDNDRWELENIDGIPWLVPPAWVDAARTPRRAGRLPSVA